MTTYLITRAEYELVIIPNEHLIKWKCVKCTPHGVVIRVISSEIEFKYLEKRED